MNELALRRLQRRDFLITAAGTAAAWRVGASGYAQTGGGRGTLRVGEGVADITPPLGIEMGGFHRPPGQERRIRSIRQEAAVRALVVQVDAVQVAICSLDVAAVSQEMAARVQTAVSSQTGIPAAHVRVCATHTHSMPGFCFLRQWGALPREFMALVEKRAVEAVCKARDDLAPAEIALGKCRVTGGNHNRIVKTARTDDQFTPHSTDDEAGSTRCSTPCCFIVPANGRSCGTISQPTRSASPTRQPGPIGRAWSQNGYGTTRSWSHRFSRGTAVT